MAFPTGNMYTETTATGANLRALADLEGINSITSAANGLLGKTNLNDPTKRERRIEYFYDQMLLDTIKLGSENNVFLKYCKVKSLPKGNEKFLLRRWGGLTEHTYPLAEGVPPKSDHMASESFEGTYQQYGRYMEFTDRVEFNLIDDVITHYSMELGDVAVRTAERLCREELEANAGVNYAGAKKFYELCIGDTVGIADYRLQALKFSRRLVKPINGNYHVICSPEHIYDLVDDPLVVKYMQYTQTAEPYVTGQPVKLFNITFEDTMLDDFAYGYQEMSNPGMYKDGSDECVRLVVPVGNEFYYLNVKLGSAKSASDPAANVALASNKSYINGLVIKKSVAEGYLKDGSYIPQKVTLEIDDAINDYTDGATKTYTIAVTKRNTSTGATEAATITVQQLYDNKDKVRQLPVHKSFMFGDEFIYKTGIDGEMNAKFYVKEKGSAGVLDPIDQRQSVGFKINTLGFNTVRPEAMVQFVFVPWQALATYNEVIDEYNIHYPTKADANGVVHPVDENDNLTAAANTKYDGGYTNTAS